MGQNGEIREGQSNELILESISALKEESREAELSITEIELIDDVRFEKSLFRLQIGIMGVIVFLATLREIFFPSDIAILDFIRELL